jgi:hypothetical protein
MKTQKEGCSGVLFFFSFRMVPRHKKVIEVYSPDLLPLKPVLVSMKMRLFTSFFLFMTLLMSAYAQTYKGPLSEEGYGKFKIMDEAENIEFLIHQSKKETTYDPADWRPRLGDVIEVNCYVKDKRFGSGASMLVANSVKLIEPGKRTLMIESPMKVKLIDIGRKMIHMQLPDNAGSVRFDKAAKMEILPVGWAPGTGDEIIIHFHAREGTFTYNISYVVTKIERP